MAPLCRIAVALLVAAILTPLAIAQAPPAPVRSRATAGSAAQLAQRPRAVTPAQAQQLRRRSIVHHYPYPYPGYYNNDRTAGFRNPGGLGRYSEYYPPGDRFQNEQPVDPVRVATFGRGGGPSLADQRAAQQIGIQKNSVMLNHIDNYARPYYGYGFGVGYFGGFY